MWQLLRWLHLLSMAFFAGGQLVLAGVLIAWHARRPQWHAIEGAVLLVSLAIVWLGVALAH